MTQPIPFGVDGWPIGHRDVILHGSFLAEFSGPTVHVDSTLKQRAEAGDQLGEAVSVFIAVGGASGMGSAGYALRRAHEAWLALAAKERS